MTFRLRAAAGQWLTTLTAVAGLSVNPAGATEAKTSTSPAPLQVRAPVGAPNVVVVLLDDVGFASSSTFGGPVATPTAEALAREGLRYNRFHTAGVCSPTRAALLSGRNSHAVGMGTNKEGAIDMSRPGYTFVHARDAATVAEILRQNGYNTAAFGKWHQTPDWEASQSGPFDRWPTGMGFEKFYGFVGGETDQYEPTLYDGTNPVMRPEGNKYHLTEDLVDHAIDWMRGQHSVTPEKPFFLYFATGAAHAPLQVSKEWSDKYRGKFDQGWDAIREGILARQKQLGVVPADTVLTPRPDALPAWDSLNANEKKVASRLMEIYSGFLEHTDTQVGRFAQELKRMEVFDNTLFIYIVGDNGGSMEGGLKGAFNYMAKLMGSPEDSAQILSKIDDLGGPSSYPQYPVGWAWATSTPFQWMKSAASHLGATRNPMVITWPKEIKDAGGIRSQFGHVNDILPTILEATHVPSPAAVNGIVQKPINGTSLVYTFTRPNAPERHRTQYFEVFGNRAIYNEGWMASYFTGKLLWKGTTQPNRPEDQNKWELYDLRNDFSQAHDLASKEPEKLKNLKSIFMREAGRNQVLPIQGIKFGMSSLPRLIAKRANYTYYSGTIGLPESQAPEMMSRSWGLTATVDVSKDGAHGVIATIGGTPGGWSLFLDDIGRPIFSYRKPDFQTVDLKGDKPLSQGRHLLQVDFDYDGGGYGKGGLFRLKTNEAQIAEARVTATASNWFSISETFDIGIDTGSPAGRYPGKSQPGFPFIGGAIKQVDIQLR